ncbi:TIGR03620 family F420-dependent LLM class oxidoreductase [Baekduia soli]|uniref:TIGR03620 family F420-dependent LLM class oxidoreductase n=1 Tax=Baekduia soli TaxID=496014 RepID=A0A5B8UAX1_9ACTN|nr:TIGR03620 family F420-dependent LLM class oxidoreductase [Baekduia soli]QEC50359.1 TIGR03620 family F420-dependent LLM class oxidoreductase [Baekduia soli]
MAQTGPVWANATETKEQVGRIGVWLGALSRAPWREAAAAARRIEELGYRALWLNETPGTKEPFAHAGMLLGVTERVVVATGIANIWTRDAIAAGNAAYALAEAHPGRFVLGLGVSHKPMVDSRGHTYDKPLTAMREYLDAMDAMPWAAPAPSVPVPVVLAALRPRMLELSRDRTAGAHPYFIPVAHTAKARSVLGDGPLLAPEVSFMLETEPARARARGREFAKLYLRLPNYTNNLRDLGYDDADLLDGGSDRLVDDVVAWGDAAAVAARVREHLDAGADHVCVQPVATDLAGSIDELERLAAELL